MKRAWKKLISFALLAQMPRLVLTVLFLCLLCAPCPARAQGASSQIVEALCRREDELKFQLFEMASRRKQLDSALKQQDSARKEAVYSHRDKKHARQDILNQISQLQKALKELEDSTDSTVAKIDTSEETTASLKQAINDLAAQEDQYYRALRDIQFVIRRARNQERGSNE